MKINEIISPLKTYIATVRVNTGAGSTTARTSITADSQQQARAILARHYGFGNVISVTEVMRETSQTCQIQRRAAIRAQAAQTKHTKKKNGPIELSCVAETESTTRILSTAELQVKSLADQAKRLNQQAKLKKAHTGLAKAQEKLRKASTAPN